MNETQALPKSLIGWWIKSSRLDILFWMSLFYFLGAGLVAHFGPALNWKVLILGWFGLLGFGLAGVYLAAHFDQTELYPQQKLLRDRPELNGLFLLPRYFFLLLGVIALIIAISIFTILLLQQVIFRGLMIFVILAFVLVLAYGLPPLQLQRTGWGQLIESLLIGMIAPALGFGLQTQELHARIGIFAFPLWLILLAMFLALGFENYARERYPLRQSLLESLGWRQGFLWHNLLLLIAYLGFSLAVLLGQPWQITWPAFLSLPVALYQFIQLNRIVQGSPPNWKVFNLTAKATLGVTLYSLFIALLL